MASPSEFLAESYAYARQAGLSDHAARLAVAQSALETGYGRSVKGNNYFGVKAGKSWNGPVQTLKTWEDVNGKRVNIRDRFRVYQSPIQSFHDWKNVVSRKWPGVFKATNFSQALAALRTGQKGGYATDKRYVTKINGINRNIDRSIGGALPNTPPLPPQRFQTIASQPVAPNAQAIRTAATLGALPVGGSTRLPAQTFAAPRGEVTRSPLAAIASAITPVSSAQAAPRANNPTLTPGAMGQGSMSLPSFASARMLAPPTSMPTQRLGAPATPPSLSPKQVAAYQDYANTRGYAPIDPVPARMPSPPTDGFLTSALPVGPAQTLQPQPAQPTFVPTPVQNPVQTPPVPQPPVQTLPKPTQQRIDEAFQTAAPPPTPRFTAADVYAGRAQSGQATGGNTVSRDPFGNISVTNKYGATTTTGPDGRQMAGSPFGGGGIGGPLGPTPPSATTAAPDVPRAPSQFGNTVRGGVGTVLGGGLGGLLAGPIGAALGAVVARDLAVGKNPIDRLGIGTFSVPVTDRFGFTQNMTFANAKSGGPFPDRPTGQAGALGGKDSNRSERSMREISPAATRDIKSGKSGLF